MIKILLFTLTVVSTLFSLLPAQEVEEYAYASAYEMRGETHYYESNTSKTMFKDINVSIALLKSTDNTLDINNIQNKEKLFTPLTKEEKFQDFNTTYWLKVDLGSTFPSGRFVCSYADPKILAHTFKPSQTLEMFKLEGLSHLKFTYTKGVDAQIYYFKIEPRHFRIPFRFVYLSTPKTFYAYISKNKNIQLILGLILGLIIMAGLYNAAMYYYNRDRAFLYYALMQLFMSLILYNYSGAFLWDEGSFFCRNMTYEYLISLSIALFATLFTVSFLELKTYLPKLYKISWFVTLIIVLDMFISLFYKSIIIEYYILPFLMLLLIYAGYKRMKQAYKPARFYLAGWIVLTIAVFLNIFRIGYTLYIIDPLYIGAATEAILFSLALSYKIRLVHKEKEEQKELLVHQSKLASMGEMIGNIAHQWRQPLTHLSYTFMNIKEAQKHGELTPEYLDSKIDKANRQLAFMSETIDDFKDFYAPKKEKETFSFLQATEETLEIMAHTFKQNNIEVELITHQDSHIYNYKNEYKQVLLNLLSNAKDALIEREIQTAKITLKIDDNNIQVEDNAKGIKEDVLKRIYEPYFTTKEGNSGIGLYMSKMIIEKNMGGKLLVRNSDKGALFTIQF